MTTIEQVLMTRLEAFTELTDLVSADGKDRIYPNVLPQREPLPAVVYQWEDSISFHNMGNTLDNCFARCTFTAYAQQSSQAKAVCNAIRKALKFWSGDGPPKVDLVQMVNDYGGFEETTDGGLLVNTHTIEFEVKYQHND